MLGLVDIVTAGVLLVLAVATLRDVIAKFFSIPQTSKLAWFFYGENRHVIVNTLRELGLQGDARIRNSLRRAEVGRHVEHPYRMLVRLISRYILKTERPLRYGKDHRRKSSYFINTMEAAHNDTDLIVMCELVAHLVFGNEKKPCPDFVVTPKVGNPVLCRKFAELFQTTSVLAKLKDESSYASIDSTEFSSVFAANFEGSDILLAKARTMKHQQLHGIVLDCNASGGSTILATIESFNRLISNIKLESGENLNIQPIDSAYVLYRPDVESDVDKSFGDRGFELKRYFDLTEEIKAQIFEFKQANSLESIDFYKRKHRNFVATLLNGLYAQGLTKSPINAANDHG